MNIKKLKKYEIFGLIFIFILGTLLHFTYGISGQNKFIAIFSAVNESVWEHLKLLFFPMLLTTIIGYFYIGKTIPNFICSKTIGILVSLFFTIVFFYTYTGILGKSVTFIDISSFFVSAILGQFISYMLIMNKFKCNSKLSITVIIILLICFITFTFFTPRINLFKDPLTNSYGFIA